MFEKAIKLESIFHDNRKYYISKIYEGIDCPVSSREYGKLHLKLIKDMFDSFKAELEEYNSLKHFDSINLLYEEVSYPFERLEKFFKGSKVINRKTARIFTYFISHKLEELKSMAGEIDFNI
ncbi:MAG: hypothetical protein ABFC57_03280 [Veillonellales bacterium]